MKNNSGFTLTETLIALLVFAIMMLMLMNLLAFSMKQRTLNQETTESIDRQVEDLASGGGLSFDEVVALFGTMDTGSLNNNIIFRDSGGNPLTVDVPNCVWNGTCATGCDHSGASTPRNVEIEGNVAGIFDDDDFMRITRPLFGGEWNEFDSIVEYNEPPSSGTMFYSNKELTPRIREFVCEEESCANSLCNDMLGHNSSGNVTWIIDLNYTLINPADSRNFVTYVRIPAGATDVVVDAGVRNCSAHVMTSDPAGLNLGTAVRIMNLSGNWARVKVTFNTTSWSNTRFLQYFDGATGGARIIELSSSDDKNFNSAASITSLPSRPCRLHSISSCSTCVLPYRY